MEEDQALFDLIIDTIIFGFLVAKTRNKKNELKLNIIMYERNQINDA